MKPLELLLLAASLFIVFLILLAEAKRGRGTPVATMNPKMLLLRIVLGIVFAILGVVGAVVPIMQGWIFFLLAILVLFPQSKFAIKSLDKIERRMPRMVARLRRWGIGVHREPESNDETVRPRVL